MKIGLGRSSRGSRSGRARASRMSWRVFATDGEFVRKCGDVGLGELGAEVGRAVPCRGRRSGAKPSRSSRLRGGFIAFGVDPGAVERVFAVDDLEEAGGLGEGDRDRPRRLRATARGGRTGLSPCGVRRSAAR